MHYKINIQHEIISSHEILNCSYNEDQLQTKNWWVYNKE